MMNNILFTKTTNKQKNIENAVIYCIHIPLSQLITADCTIQEGKMVASPEMTSPEPEVVNQKWKGDNFPCFCTGISRVFPGTPLDSR
jgi:hypothetical protein